jgi:hypothetical protein
VPAAAPRPGVDAEAVTALKQKIDALEKNIVAQLEKKMGEQLKSSAAVSAAPPPPPPAAQLNERLYRRIEELERRLADFGQAASLSASQLKNIEESKISARREIEHMLKAVREQHKYTEMDQQMHQQLEKSWARAEELEKKLMDFYSTVLQMESLKREETADVSDKTVKALEALGDRLSGLEAKLAQLAAAPEAAERQLRAAQAAQEASARELLAGMRENSASFKEVFDNYVRRELELLRDKVAAETEAMRRSAAESAEGMARLLKDQQAAAAEKNAEFEKLAKANTLKVEGIEASLQDAARRQTQALEDFSRKIGRDGDARMERFGAKYADALLSVTFVEGFRSALTESVDKLDAYEKQIAAFLKDVSPAQLENVLGVSGMMLRKHFAALASASSALKEDSGRLREIKRKVEESFKDIFRDR